MAAAPGGLVEPQKFSCRLTESLVLTDLWWWYNHTLLVPPYQHRWRVPNSYLVCVFWLRTGAHNLVGRGNIYEETRLIGRMMLPRIIWHHHAQTELEASTTRVSTTTEKNEYSTTYLRANTSLVIKERSYLVFPIWIQDGQKSYCGQYFFEA
jgi:hypothetical protein